MTPTFPGSPAQDAEIAAVRKRIAAQPADKDLAANRKRLDLFGDAQGVPDGVTLEVVDAGGVTGEWAIPDEADDGRTILYIHGGGYAAGSIASDRHLAAALALESRARVLSLDYRRAPESPFPAAVDDVVRAYRFVLAQGAAAEQIAVAGLSAGGGLALSLMISAREAELALPACAWLASPWSDLSNPGDSMRSLAIIDPVINESLLGGFAKSYLHGASPRDPLASPCFGNLHGLPPILIQVGAAETLLDDSVKLARNAGAANVAVTLEVWPRMIHGFQLLSPELSDGRLALAAAGAFIRKMTSAPLKP